MAQNETQYEKYLRNGKEIFDTYCSTDDKHPIMLPRAPQQTYIDRYPNEDQPGCSFKNDRQQQLNYEAEVAVYRALEKLGEHLIVLHSFEYTHFQYHLGDSSHDKRKCTKCKKMASNREGECDFVVIASNYFVIIEVKNMDHISELSDPGCNKDQQLRALANTFQKSLQQRKKMVELIKRFCKRLTVRQFTVYPNFEKSFKSEFQLSRDEKSTIIFKDDVDDFSNWWEDNVSDLVLKEPLRPEYRTKHEEVRNLLLAIWCTDKGTCDKLKCSLGRCIFNIDEQLRSGRFTFRSNNPEAVPTPKFVKDFLGVDNLTKQQYDLINSTEKFLWISGPAGAGKTVVLMAKILELVLSSEDNKVVLFGGTMINTEGIKSSESQDRRLEKAGIKHVFVIICDNRSKITKTEYQPSELHRQISSHLIDYQVVIVMIWGSNHDQQHLPGIPSESISEWLNDLFGLLKGINVFVDDMQVGLVNGGGYYEYKILETLFELPRSHHVWVACDMVQKRYGVVPTFTSKHDAMMASFFNDKLSSSQLVCLSKNLRNTSDVSSTLSVIRNQVIELRTFDSNFVNSLFPLQAYGHYIHGPKVVIHVLENFNKELFYSIFAKELDKLSGNNFPNYIDKIDTLGIIQSSLQDKDAQALVTNIIYEVLQSMDMLPILVMAPYVMEWPAVIAILTLEDNFFQIFKKQMETLTGVESENVESSIDFENLYFFMSRARVKCTIIMFPMEGMIFDDFHRMKDLLHKLEDSVEIRRYPLTPPSYTPRSFTEPRSFIEYGMKKFPNLNWELLDMFDMFDMFDNDMFDMFDMLLDGGWA